MKYELPEPDFGRVRYLGIADDRAAYSVKKTQAIADAASQAGADSCKYEGELPELPAPKVSFGPFDLMVLLAAGNYYTEKQLQDYARQAVAGALAQQPAPAAHVTELVEALELLSSPAPVTALEQQESPIAWAIEGCSRMWRGEFAEADAKAEAVRCGGTCHAYPLYTAAPAPQAQEAAPQSANGRYYLTESQFRGLLECQFVGAYGQAVKEMLRSMTQVQQPAQQPAQGSRPGF